MKRKQRLWCNYEGLGRAAATGGGVEMETLDKRIKELVKNSPTFKLAVIAYGSQYFNANETAILRNIEKFRAKKALKMADPFIRY